MCLRSTAKRGHTGPKQLSENEARNASNACNACNASNASGAKRPRERREQRRLRGPHKQTCNASGGSNAAGASNANGLVGGSAPPVFGLVPSVLPYAAGLGVGARVAAEPAALDNSHSSAWRYGVARLSHCLGVWKRRAQRAGAGALAEGSPPAGLQQLPTHCLAQKLRYDISCVMTIWPRGRSCLGARAG